MITKLIFRKITMLKGGRKKTVEIFETSMNKYRPGTIFKNGRLPPDPEIVCFKETKIEGKKIRFGI